jgi:serine/threonine protein phosphatase PrpC
MSRIRIAAVSEQGARNYNEDAVAFGTSSHGHYAVLADGAGGHRRGAEAAQRAVRSIEELLRDETIGFSPANLTQIVRLAHSELQHHQDSDDDEARMHCTIVVLWLDTGLEHVLWTHVGDSRLYRIRHGQTDVVTADDSVVQRMLQAGLIKPEQVRGHPQKNQLLAALGMADDIEPHTVVRPVELQEGDAFLLCTDGWWDAFEPETLATLALRALDPEQWLEEMRQTIVAQARPRQDNFSAIALWYGEPGEVARPGADDTMPGLLRSR